MAFGFDDFAGLFDPISDVLGTSGRKGVGLLQQEPEDLQRAAMLAALAASGYGMLTAAAPGAAGIAAAGPSAALVTPEVAALAPEVLATAAPEVATLGAEEAARIAAQEAAQSGILQANQMNPELLNSINGPGVQSADMSSGLQDYFETARDKLFGRPVDLNPPDYRALSTEQPFARTSAYAIDAAPQDLINADRVGHGAEYLGNSYPGTGTGPQINTAYNPNEVLRSGYGAEYQGNAYPGIGHGAEYQGNAYPGTGYGLEDKFYEGSPESEAFKKDFNERLAFRSAEMPGSNVQHFNNPASTTQNVFRGNPAEAGFQPPQVSRGGYFNNGISGEYTDTLTPFERGMETAGRYFDKTADYIEKNPYKSAGLAYYGASKLGLLDQPKQEPIADNYKNPYSMAGFRRSSPNPSAYRYTPRYAEGGIASVHSYAKGGRSKAKSAMDFYDAMNPQQESAPLRHGDPGIYYDMDPDTRYLDPMEAAMVRMSKLNSRTNVQAPTMAPSRRMGELDFKPVAAAQGGIMGYASGGDVPIEEDEFRRLTERGGGGRTKEEPGVKFSPTSEGAAAVSKLGQRLSSYPVMAPLGFGMKIAGALASSYGDHMARNVNPDYSNEGRQQMQAAQSAAQDAGIAAHDAQRSGGDRNSVTPGGGSSDARPAPAENRGYGREGQHAAQGGIMGYNLGGYAAGGNPRLLRGPGDGMSDHIPATINNRQPARLADGEYVITADVVSHLGNGSTEAGARQLDAMMKRIRKGRTGTPKQGKQINPRKYLPA